MMDCKDIEKHLLVKPCVSMKFGILWISKNLAATLRKKYVETQAARTSRRGIRKPSCKAEQQQDLKLLFSKYRTGISTVLASTVRVLAFDGLRNLSAEWQK